MDSILNSVKEYCGIEVENTAFDSDLIMTTNAVLFVLNQFGIGPDTPYSITSSEETWGDLLGSDPIGGVSEYVKMRVRLLFDPPTNPQVLEALKGQIEEFQWRILLDADSKSLLEEVTDE